AEGRKIDDRQRARAEALHRFREMLREEPLAADEAARLRALPQQRRGHVHRFAFSWTLATSAVEARRSSGKVSLLKRTSTEPGRLACALIVSTSLSSNFVWEVFTVVFTVCCFFSQSGDVNQPPPRCAFSSVVVLFSWLDSDPVSRSVVDVSVAVTS